MDIAVTDRTLRRYLAGAMDPGRREELEAALAVSPTLRARLAGLVASTVSDEPSAWRVPPVGAPGPWSLSPMVQAGAAMSDEDAVAGDYVELRFQAPAALDAADVFVLERLADGDWEVLFPASADERLPARAFPREPDGRLRLDVVLNAGSTGRIAVALVPSDVSVAWSEPAPARWVELLTALGEGRVAIEAATAREGA